MTKPATATAPETPPVDLLTGLTEALEPAFRLEHLVALSRERALYQAWDRMLKRFVALRVHLSPDSPGRACRSKRTRRRAVLPGLCTAGVIRALYNWITSGSKSCRTATCSLF